MTPERKQQLLLQARKERIAWVNVASNPYRKRLIDDDSAHCLGEDDIALLQSLNVCQFLPSAPNVLRDLYQQNNTLHATIDGLEHTNTKKRIAHKVGIDDFRKMLCMWDVSN
mmetsp:Transcript_20191/g.58398  ORF Transcript_20191/g.58398 Transcript_20191/m.58398 type:complete len:112 (-) Transcript_20191:4176-4511(-)